MACSLALTVAGLQPLARHSDRVRHGDKPQHWNREFARLCRSNWSHVPIARGKLNLIDLAGSERAEKSGVSDDKKMFDEAKNINLVWCSVMCFADV